MEIDNIQIKWLGHSGFLITSRGVSFEKDKSSKIIYIDPYNIKEGSEKADLILITHSHYDHCSVVDINKIVKGGTKIIMSPDCQSKVARFKVPIRMEVAEPDQEFSFGDIKIIAFPSYNLGKPFHPKDELWLGYLIKMNGLLIYHAGDTDVIPEMQKLTGFQSDKKLIALLPVGGRFTMTAEEAVEAAKIIKPFIAIPMHYGNFVGTERDAKEFKELCEEEGIRVEILEKE